MHLIFPNNIIPTNLKTYLERLTSIFLEWACPPLPPFPPEHPSPIQFPPSAPLALLCPADTDAAMMRKRNEIDLIACIVV